MDTALKHQEIDATLESYFDQIRKHVIGYDQTFDGPYGPKKIIYADWTASGRLYEPIESLISREIGPFVANTHTETTFTGTSMTKAYHKAKEHIKEHVGAHHSDILISSNSGMTGVVNKFQRILGLKVHERFRDQIKLEDRDIPVIFVSHMEHHSNQTSWLETISHVEVIKPLENGLMDLEHLRELLEVYRYKKTKIAAITSCSNVTGIKTPYHEVARIMHENEGYCFVDFACSAPYIDINMRPEDPKEHLDAFYFSPHKFLGGPGSSGILIFDPKLYKNRIPDNPGGGTVKFTNPWGEHIYLDEIEAREDGGTPGFLQTIKVALSLKLKEEMSTNRILKREQEILERIWPVFDSIPNLHIMANNHRNRLGVISFTIEDLHFNLGVQLLNDKYGIQTRGGCSCAGTYGHYLLHLDKSMSSSIRDEININNLKARPGWIRMSIHPVMTNEEIDHICQAIKEVAENHQEWANDYIYDKKTNEFTHKNAANNTDRLVNTWFDKSLI